jgi:hypothetical protein
MNDPIMTIALEIAGVLFIGLGAFMRRRERSSPNNA